MAVSLIIFAIMLSLTKAQEYFESDNEISGYNYSNNSNCIGNYGDLEEYVLNNKDLINNLTEVYFKTGESHAEFVKITYKFKVLLPANSTIDTLSYGNDDGELTCVDSQKKFIWSSSALYLLGPKPLLWLTLFAVHIHESSLTVQLPCLCSDAYDVLLPRLTYLIKVYPAMRYQSQTVQFISTYYFETKAPDEDNYKAIVNILFVSVLLPLATFFLFSYLMCFYSEWMVRLVEKYVADGNKKVGRKGLRDKRNKHGSTNDDQDEEEEEEEKQSRRITIAALIVTSICLSIALFVFHIIASVELIQYGNEVLNDVNLPSDIDITSNEHQDRDDQAIPIWNTVFTFFLVIILVIGLSITIILYCFCQDSGSRSVDEALGSYLRLSFGVLIIYLGFYFSTYMILAFITDPIVTGFVYLIGVLCILGVFLVSHFLCFLVFLCLACQYNWEFVKPSFGDWRYIIFTLVSGISLGYFLAILIFILTLGNFHDFEAVQNLTLPLVIGLLSFFVFKPFYESIKNSVKIDTTDHDTDRYDVTTENPEANVNNAGHA